MDAPLDFKGQQEGLKKPLDQHIEGKMPYQEPDFETNQRHCSNGSVILEKSVSKYNIQTIDSDWLPTYKCLVINQSEMMLEGNRPRGLIKATT